MEEFSGRDSDTSADSVATSETDSEEPAASQEGIEVDTRLKKGKRKAKAKKGATRALINSKRQRAKPKKGANESDIRDDIAMGDSDSEDNLNATNKRKRAPSKSG
jgi:hypothetical protein